MRAVGLMFLWVCGCFFFLRSRLDSREKFLMWTCRAHNEVNKRQRKKEFPCEVKALDDRWGDCGCK